MARLVREYRKTPDIRLTAQTIIRDANISGHKNYPAMIRAIHGWVQRNIQYLQDVRGTETVQTPIKTLEFRQGDCDDQSTLLSSLLESIGFRTRFTAIKSSPLGPFIHVYTEVSFGRRWIPLETTEKWEAGRGPSPSIVAGRMIEDI
jgi:transglutaminase-like putative cysteine protease